MTDKSKKVNKDGKEKTKFTKEATAETASSPTKVKEEKAVVAVDK